MFGDSFYTFCVCEKYGFYDEMSIEGDEFCGCVFEGFCPCDCIKIIDGLEHLQ